VHDNAMGLVADLDRGRWVGAWSRPRRRPCRRDGLNERRAAVGVKHTVVRLATHRDLGGAGCGEAGSTTITESDASR